MESGSPVTLTAADLPVRFGRYTLESILGEGGMAKVFRAQLEGPAGFRKTVALKVIKSQMSETMEKQQRELFLREARLGGLLRHPNLVDVYELGHVDDTWFLSMEWIDGLTLFEAGRLGAMQPSVLVPLARKLCGGLEDAHTLKVKGQRVGLVHRDLKPSNVLLGWKGSVKIADFGLAHMAVRVWEEDYMCMSGGSPGYMSPEQWSNGPVDHRSDLFALGCLLYELATGKYLFELGSHAMVKQATLDVDRRLESSDELQAVDDRVEGLGPVVGRCLRVNPGERYRSAAELNATLHELEKKLPRTPSLAEWMRRLSGQKAPVFEQTQPTLVIDSFESLPEVDDAATSSNTLPKNYTNILPESNTFVGRENELAQLGQLVQTGHRLVTVLGPPGTGKTRLAQRFTRQWLQAGHCESAWFCDITEARTEKQVLHAMARVLKIPLTGKKTDEALLADRLGHVIASRGVTVLLIDNAEQVAESVSRWVRLWWERAPLANFVITSRVPLRLEQEQQLILDPLPLPKRQGVLSESRHNASIELFVTRARMLNPDFKLNASNAENIVAIVCELDGLPLAIELAAARTRMWPPHVLRARLSDRFRLLSRPVVTGSRRQATLRGALDWSWDLLQPWEQAVLAQCSVFRGGFDWEAAEAVIDLVAWPEESPWAVDVLATLMEHSLVMVKLGPAGESRLSMLVSVRAYAAEKLGGMGQQAVLAAKRRHARHYATFGSIEHLESLDRHGGVQRWGQLHNELENLVAAAHQSIESEWIDEATGACFAAQKVWHIAGPFEPALQLYNQLLGLNVPRSTQARLLQAKGLLLRQMGDPQLALVQFMQALVIAQEVADRPLQGLIICQLGILRMGQGQTKEGLEHYKQALHIARELGNRRLEGLVRSNQSLLYLEQGRMEEALKHFTQALAIHREIGDRRFEGIVLGNLSGFYTAQDRLVEAQAHYKQALAIHREVGNRQSEGIVLGYLAILCTKQGRLKEAHRRYNQALAIHREVGHRRSEGVMLGFIAVLFAKQGQLGNAHVHYTQALTIHRQVGNRRSEGVVLGNLGELHLEQGEPDHAMELYVQALAIHREVGNRRSEGLVLGNIAKVHQQQGRLSVGHAHYKQALAIHRELGDRRFEGLVLGDVGDLLLKEGELSAAETHFIEAIAIVDKQFPLASGVFRGSLALVRAQQGSFKEALELLARGEKQLRSVHTMELVRLLCKRSRVLLLATEPDAARTTLNEAESIAKTLSLAPAAPLLCEIAALRDQVSPTSLPSLNLNT